MARRLAVLGCASVMALSACLFPSLGGLSDDVDAAADAASDGALPSYVTAVTADVPASWWRLGESDVSQPAADQMNIQPGTYRTPGVTVGAKGAIVSDPNTAITLDGLNGAMFIPGTAYDLGGNVPFAIEIWVRPLAAESDDTGDSSRRIMSHRTEAPYIGWYLLIDGTQTISFTRWDNSNTVTTLQSNPLVTGVYSHIVVSSDATSIGLFVNGVQVAESPATAITSGVAAQSLALGCQSDFGGEWFAGSLDEAAIYTHALSAARVLAHYQAGIQSTQ